MKDLSLQTRMMIWATLITAALISVYELIYVPWQQNWAAAIVLSILGVVFLLIRVEGATNRTHYNITFLVYGFSFVMFGVPITIIVIIITHLVEWIWHRYPWYIQLFNLSSFIIVAAVSNFIFEFLNPARVFNTWEATLAMLAAMVGFTVLNHLLVGTIVWLARGENFVQSGVFDFFSIAMDFVLLSMGAGATVIWNYNPLAIIFILLPLYLIYSTLRVPSLERQTETDPKTGAYNNNYFYKSLNEELRRAHRFNHPLSIVMADLDFLRNINNSYGHLAGDEVLIGVANLLKQETREYDVVARFGGEEFAIVMPETTSQQAFRIIESIRNSISNKAFSVPTSVTVINATMSFGIAQWQPGLDAKTIIHNADLALYHAKLKGRNRSYIYSDEGFDSLFLPESKVASSVVEEIPANSKHQPGAISKSPSVRLLESQEPILSDSGRTSKPKSSKKSNHLAKKRDWSNLYISLLTLAATLLIVRMGIQNDHLDWYGLVTLMAMAAITEWASIDIYVRDSSVSVSAVPLIASILLFSPSGVVLIGLTIAIVAWIKHRSPVSRLIFNASNQLLAGMICLWLLASISPGFWTWAFPIQIIVSSLTALVLFMITSALVSVGISFQSRSPFHQIWLEKFSWLAPSYAGMGLIAYTLIFSYRQSGVLGILAILVSLVLLRISQYQFIERTKTAVQELKVKNQKLEEHSNEITLLNDGLLDTLAEVIDLRDPFVLGHSRQVTQYAVMIAQQMSLSTRAIEMIRKASLMHDVGKLGINQKILSKPSSLTAQEYEDMKRHVNIGVELLKKSKAMQTLVPIILQHHEHFDGSGYPLGLKGDEICLEARIVCLADALDAMASDRPYHKAMSFQEIFTEVQACSGTHFDPVVVAAFEKVTAEKGQAILVNSISGETVLSWKN